MHASLKIFIFCTFLSVSFAARGFINQKISRKIDISTHLVKVSTQITTQSDGDDSYIVAIDSGFEDNLSFIGAISKIGDEEKEFVVTETKDSTPDSRRFAVHLDGPSSGKPVSFQLTTVFAHKLIPYPSEIGQAEKQLIKFSGNLYFLSPYPTDSQETQVLLTSSSVLSYSQAEKPVNKQEAVINYGPYKEKPAFAKGELTIHYENNSPFLTVTSLTRLIEVSHWGNVAIEETVDLYHSGARLHGAFSRYEYHLNQGGVSSVKAIKTVLPAAARDVYYRDEIGNISTSHLRELVDSVEVELRPRFPLFGGWKTQYTLGYNVPSYEYLYNKGDMFALRMRFVDHIYDDQVVDHATVKIILPEGATDIRLEAPYPVQQGPRQVLYTYLDVTGRPVIIAHKANLVEQHIKEFKIYYRFKLLRLVFEPLMVIIAFFLLFLVVIIYVRLDFSITKDEASESRMRVAGLVEEVQTSQDKRSALYQSYEDAINKFKASKDQARFGNDRKKIDGDHKTLTQQIGALHDKLKQDSAEVADKVNELQSLDKKFKDQIQESIHLAERLVSTKINKTQYLESEQKIAAKKTEILTKMDSIVASW